MSFTTTEVDKFKNHTIQKINSVFTLKQDFTSHCVISMEVQYSVIGIENAPPLKKIRLIITLVNDEWWFLRNGQLIFLVDNQKIAITPSSHNEETGVKINDKVKGIRETLVYLLEISDFKKICDAQQVSVQISGNTWKHETDLNKLILKHFRAFYHEVIDKSTFNNEYGEINSFHKQKKRNIVNTFIVFLLTIVLWMLSDYFIAGGKWSVNEETFAESGYHWGISLFDGIMLGIFPGLIFYFVSNFITKRKTNK